MIHKTYEILMIFLYSDLNLTAWLDHLDLLKTEDIWPLFFVEWWIFKSQISRRILPRTEGKSYSQGPAMLFFTK